MPEAGKDLVLHYIDAELVPGTGSKRHPIYNPATGEVTKYAVMAEQADVDAAVASAKKAFATWSQTSLGRRTAVLFKFRELLHANTDKLAEIITSEHGKVFSDARGEVGRGLDVVEFACGIPQLLKGEYSDEVSTGLDVFSYREPLGVVGGITPFNFPVMVPLWMIPIAIATGNTFVLKASKQDPSSSVFMAQLWSEAGLPPGVLNVVHGDRHVVDALLTHPDIEAISFVGSTPVAHHVFDTGTSHGKQVQALAGAKNHGIVLADADLDSAADHVVAAAFGSAGERCMALPTIAVVDQIADEFVALLTQKARAVKVTCGMEPDADMGPIVTKGNLDRINGIISRAEGQGAKLVLDGRDLVVPGYEGGFFTGPTIIDNVSTEMECYIEEIFGPVLDVVRIKDLDEGIALINANPYGNGAAIFTSDGESARRFHRGVDVGMIGINVPIPVPVAYHSFGGWKESMVGESHIYGPEGVKFYTRAKVVTQRWPRTKADAAASFHFAGASQADSQD